MAKPQPALDVPVLTPSGLMNQAWFEYFQGLQRSVGGLLDTSSFSVPPVTPGSTSASVTSIAKTQSTSPAGSVQTFLIYSATSPTFNQELANDMTTIADALSKASTNDANLAAAVSAFNTRVTALENKINAVISDLDARFP